MNNITLREAKVEDCERIMELIHELAEYEKAPNEVTVSLEHFKEQGFGAKPIYWAWVACTPENNIIAFALYYIRYSTWKGTRMYLEDLLVTESYRKKGVGSLLLDKLIEIAKQKKFSGIMWQVLDWNEPAIHFYKKRNVKMDGEWLNCSMELL